MRQPNQWERPSAHNPRKITAWGFIVCSAEHLTFCSNYLFLQLIKGVVIVIDRIVEKYWGKYIRKCPVNTIFSQFLKFPTGLCSLPACRDWLIFLEASGLLALSFKDVLLVGITPWMALGSANPSSPLQPLLFLFKEHFGEVKKVQTLGFSFLQASPKQCVLPHKHKGTSVNLALHAWIILQFFIFLGKARGRREACFSFYLSLHFDFEMEKKSLNASSRNLSISYFWTQGCISGSCKQFSGVGNGKHMFCEHSQALIRNFSVCISKFHFVSTAFMIENAHFSWALTELKQRDLQAR